MLLLFFAFEGPYLRFQVPKNLKIAEHVDIHVLHYILQIFK